MAFQIDNEVAARGRELYANSLAAIEIPASFAEPVRERFYEPEGGMNQAEFRAYVNAFIDLYRLLEEIRFELALGWLLLNDYEAKVGRGEAPPRHTSELPLPLPAESVALALRHMSQPPAPDELFANPYTVFAGHRILSDWYVGQLLDSVLVREVAACDRLATMLWTRAGLPVHVTKAGREHHPAFRDSEMKDLAEHYDTLPAWSKLAALSSHELFEFTKNLRDDFTHARRFESALHGEEFTTFASEDVVTQGASADEHLGIGVEFYNEVLRPAIELTGELLASRTKPVPDGGAEKLAAMRELYDEASEALARRSRDAPE
jgi:hypothetical protein